MKKIALLLALILSVSTLLALCSCTEEGANSTHPVSQSSPAEESSPDTPEKGSSLLESGQESADNESVVKPSPLPSPSSDPQPSSASEPSESPEDSLSLDPALLGKWQSDLDMTEMYVEMFTLSLGEEVAPYFRFEDFQLIFRMTLQLSEDGNYTASLDTETAKKSMEDLISIVKDGLKRYMTDAFTAEAEKLETTLEAYLEYAFEEEIDDTDAYIDGLVEQSLDGMTAENLLEGMEETNEIGFYGTKDGLVYFYEHPEEALEITNSMTYTFDGDGLILDPHSSEVDAMLFHKSE